MFFLWLDAKSRLKNYAVYEHKNNPLTMQYYPGMLNSNYPKKIKRLREEEEERGGGGRRRSFIYSSSLQNLIIILN